MGWNIAVECDGEEKEISWPSAHSLARFKYDVAKAFALSNDTKFHFVDEDGEKIQCFRYMHFTITITTTVSINDLSRIHSPLYKISHALFFNRIFTMVYVSHSRPVKIFLKIDFRADQLQQTGPQANDPELQQHPKRKSRKRRRRACHTNDQSVKLSLKRVIKRQENSQEDATVKILPPKRSAVDTSDLQKGLLKLIAALGKQSQ